MVKSATEWAEKQVRRSLEAADDYARGVQNPERPWKESTIKADAKRKANLAKAESEGRWLKRIQSKDEGEWSRKASTVGARNYGPGVKDAEDKIKRFAEIQAPQVQALQGKVHGMPDVSEDDRKNRLLANFEGMKKTGYK